MCNNINNKEQQEIMPRKQDINGRITLKQQKWLKENLEKKKKTNCLRKHIIKRLDRIEFKNKI